jgi:hypothetical protein
MALRWEVEQAASPVVVEHVMAMPVDFFAEATPADVGEATWLRPDHVDDDGRYLMSFHAFVLDANGRRIVVDTGCGDDKDRPLIPELDRQARPFLARLAAAGIEPDSVDVVVNTPRRRRARAGSHFAGSSAGRIERDHAGFRFVGVPGG